LFFFDQSINKVGIDLKFEQIKLPVAVKCCDISKNKKEILLGRPVNKDFELYTISMIDFEAKVHLRVKIPNISNIIVRFLFTQISIL
jgi:hypothetical protein